MLMKNTSLLFRSWRQLAAIFYLCLVFTLSFYRSEAFANPADVDLELSNLELTPGDERNFVYSFSLTNNGTSSIQGYSMKLTFSSNGTLDGGDYFSIVVPFSNVAAQYIGPSQTLEKTEHFYAASQAQYLPTGTWYVFAEINDDRAIIESNYDNNIVTSSNSITVNPYKLTFVTPPVVEEITESSFNIAATFNAPITIIYYLYQPSNMATPDADAIKASAILSPWEPNVAIEGLGPAFHYDVYCIGEANDGNSTDIYKINVTTAGAAIPTLIAPDNDLQLSPTSINSISEAVEFSISAYHLSGNVFVTPPAKFVVSKDDIEYSDQISFTPEAFASSTFVNVYIKANEFGSAGIKTGTIILESSGAGTITADISIPIFDPTDSDFDGITSLSQSGWSTYSVAGFHSWTLIDLTETSVDQRTKGEDWAMQIDGAASGNTTEEDWLISPSIDLSSFTYHPTLKFRSYSSGAGEKIKLMYSADYPGFGNPSNATWFDTEVEFPDVNSSAWKNSRIELSNRETNLHFAFIYTSSSDEGSRWTVDNWRITDALVEIPSDILRYEEVAVGSNSESKPMDIEVVGYGDITVTASAGFQVSLDNATFASSVVVLEDEVTIGKTIYVRFTPAAESEEFPGTLTFTGTDLSITNEQLVGSTSTITAAERSIRNTGFIYPNPTNGPVHVDLEAFDATDITVQVSVINNLGSTVAYFEGNVAGVEDKLSDVTTSMAPGLYHITIKGSKATYRNKLVRK